MQKFGKKSFYRSMTMAKVAPIVNQEKVDRFLRIFPPRMKQMAKQIKLIDNCSKKMNYEWSFTDTVPTFFIVIFKELTLVARKFDLEVDVRIGGKSIEDTYEEANDKFQDYMEGQ